MQTFHPRLPETPETVTLVTTVAGHLGTPVPYLLLDGFPERAAARWGRYWLLPDEWSRRPTLDEQFGPVRRLHVPDVLFRLVGPPARVFMPSLVATTMPTSGMQHQLIVDGVMALLDPVYWPPLGRCRVVYDDFPEAGPDAVKAWLARNRDHPALRVLTGLGRVQAAFRRLVPDAHSPRWWEVVEWVAEWVPVRRPSRDRIGVLTLAGVSFAFWRALIGAVRRRAMAFLRSGDDVHRFAYALRQPQWWLRLVEAGLPRTVAPTFAVQLERELRASLSGAATCGPLRFRGVETLGTTTDGCRKLAAALDLPPPPAVPPLAAALPVDALREWCDAFAARLLQRFDVRAAVDWAAGFGRPLRRRKGYAAPLDDAQTVARLFEDL